MCGIAGFTGEDREKIEWATMSLRHRGPDHQAWEVTHGSSIGNARLAILDPRPEGNQPMWNKERTMVITYNGEIYNYRRLREQEQLVCETNTDTEVVIKLYEKYGIEGCVKRLRGMFAFGIFDTRDQSWHLARDPGGILPLFVSIRGKHLAFASEMRTLMKILPEKPALDLASLSAYVRLQYVPGSETMCEGIYSLPPGTILSWKDGTMLKEMVIQEQPERLRWSRKDFLHNIHGVMDAVVSDHCIADKSVGVFLSGGMDSSIILHHMTKIRTKPIDTFTVRFDVGENEERQRFNRDADLAALTAKHYGTSHHELLISASDYRDAYKKTAEALDQPNADSVSVALYLLSQHAKQFVDVVLSGAGGDERFGGYPRYRVARILDQLRFMPAGMRSFFGGLAGHPRDVLRLRPGALLAERLLARPVQELQPIVRGHWFDASVTTALFGERFPDTHDGVRNFMEFDRTLWLTDESLRLTDSMTLAHGVESRVPFLDARVASASLAVPSSSHVTFSKTKALMKEAYKDVLPSHLFSLSKASFYPPLGKWLRRECSDLAEEALESKRIAELFDVQAIRKVWEDHRDHRAYGLHTLQMIIALNAWFSSVYDA